MSLTATYVDSSTFTVSGDKTAEFVLNRRVKANCGTDGNKYSSVSSSSYDSGADETTVNLNDSNLTSNLSEVWFGVVPPQSSTSAFPQTVPSEAPIDGKQYARQDASWSQITTSDPGLVLIANATASNDATVDFTSGIDSTYDEYEIHLINVSPTAEAELRMKTTSDNGSTWDEGSSDYTSTFSEYNSSGATQESYTLSEAYLCGNITIGYSTEKEYTCSILHLFKPSDASIPTRFNEVASSVTPNTYLSTARAAHMRNEDNVVNGVRFYFNAFGCDIEFGEFKLYGIKKS